MNQTNATPPGRGSDRARPEAGEAGWVHVVAPSGPVNPERVRRGLAHVGRRYGAPTLAANLERRAGYFAGDDRERLEALDLALRDDRARVVWAARGGYGATRLLARLDPTALRGGDRRKVLVGFSDVSALLCWAWVHARVPSIHGPVVAQLAELPEHDRQRLWDLLEGELPPPLVADEHGASLHGGRVEGPLIVANLEVLRTLIGTPHMPSLDGAILALEEIGERPYRIDRALTQLLESGSLRGVVGVAVGDLHGCVEPEGGGSRGFTADEVLDDRLGRLGVPVVLGLPFGHAPTRNAALAFGVRSRLDADQGSLEQLEPISNG
ncbi:putative murein peptide carboxypeptidase [Enhygromyxa salina]|uniref:Putative murein peptide carboxypeptidase n=1 Tax=Enhygromyxa salina TaxID=215803 RepID=A0A2S9YG88_9BACT|nr:LD-carboxypeptidase [Enhygromyxa salina]PRQ04120.1 putative murein peptide carboxypeptidase [Enhygromyxa salina]